MTPQVHQPPGSRRLASRQSTGLTSPHRSHPSHAITRIGNEHPDSLITYPDAPILSGCANPIQVRGSHLEATPRTPAGPLVPKDLHPATATPAQPAAHTPDVTRASRNGTWPRQRRVNNAQTQHIDNAQTKRARTIRSGRATYSAQALGRLPWFAPCLRRSRRLRPRFDMSFSLGLLSRLKHFCTH